MKIKKNSQWKYKKMSRRCPIRLELPVAMTTVFPDFAPRFQAPQPNGQGVSGSSVLYGTRVGPQGMWKEQVWVQIGPETGRGAGGGGGPGSRAYGEGARLRSVNFIYPTPLCPPGSLAPLHSARLRHRGAHETGELHLGQLWVSLGWGWGWTSERRDPWGCPPGLVAWPRPALPTDSNSSIQRVCSGTG